MSLIIDDDNQEYLKERAKLIKLDKRNDDVQKGYPDDDSNTVYFSVVDGEGNACSFIVSVFIDQLCMQIDK